jgi:hypothetical protein
MVSLENRHTKPLTQHHTPANLNPKLLTLNPDQVASADVSGKVYVWMSHGDPHTLNPAPCTLHLARFILHSAPQIPHNAPYTRHPTPYTLYPTPCSPHHTPHTLKPMNLHPAICTLHPTFTNLHPPSYTLHPTTSTPHIIPGVKAEMNPSSASFHLRTTLETKASQPQP